MLRGIYCEKGVENFHDVSTEFASIPCDKESGEGDSCNSLGGIVLLLLPVALLVTSPVAFKLRF